MPTSNNSSDEHEKSMCESDAYDVSVTEHSPPLPTGEGQGGGAFTAIKAYHSPPCGGGVRGWGFAWVGLCVVGFIPLLLALYPLSAAAPYCA